MIRKALTMALLFPGILMANYEQQGQAFGEQLLNQGFGDAQSTLNEIGNEWDKQGNFTQQTEELKSSFGSGYDSGKKGEDPLKGYFSQKTTEASKNKAPNQPSLGDAETLLKQKHRFKISPDDPLFKRQKEICEAEVDKEGVFKKGQPKVKAPELKDKTVTCRVGSAGIEKSCVKNRVINLGSRPVSSVRFYLGARAHTSTTYTINFATGYVTLVNNYPSGTDYYVGDHTIMNNMGIVGYVGINEQVSNPSSADVVNYTGVIERTNGNINPEVLQHPSYTNGYVAKVKVDLLSAPSYEHMQVLQARLQWQVTGAPSLADDTWQGCEELERQAYEGFCELVANEQQGVNESRKLEDYPSLVNRDYWSELKTFHCGAGRDIDTCKTLLDQGCEQINSQCAETKNGLCVEYENTFKCAVPEYLKGDGLEFKNGQLSFIKEPTSYHEGYDAGGFGQAVTQFNALTEVGKQLQDEIGDPNNPSVFKGKCSQCRVNIGSFFRDCCKLKGVLQGLFGQCNEEEKQLAVDMIKKQRCVKVEGRYCHKKTLGKCTEKRDSYCCYGSKLARIIQEIAHQQLGISWGSAEHPNCASLTAEQLSQIDFDTPYAQEKLSEVLAEVQATAQEKFELVQNMVANLGNPESKIKSLEQQQNEALYQSFASQGFSRTTIKDNPHYQDFKQRQEKEHLESIAKQYWAEKEALLKKVAHDAGYMDFEWLINHYKNWDNLKQLNCPSYMLDNNNPLPQLNLDHVAIDIGILNFPQCHEDARAINRKYKND